MSHTYPTVVKNVLEFSNSYLANEDAIVASHQRDKLSGESKLAFQNSLLNPFNNFLECESKRYLKAKRQLTNQQTGSFRIWRRLNRFLIGARGPWRFSNDEKETEYSKHWRLSNVENFARMRLKLSHNYSFDPHVEAAVARDDRTVTNAELAKQLPDIDVKPMLEDENDGDEG